ncbi:MAG: cupin domain-containing protein [Anaerolineales bacterium]|jgi:ethanolamine utilization protein EutQ (cupin superfamily)
MKVITRDELIQGMVDHPYDTNPDLVAKVNFFYFSKDRKMAMAYYESPPGWFDVEVSGFDEIDAILEGEVELISGEATLTAKQGDCFLVQDGDKFRWRMTRDSKMIFFIYPLTKEIEDLITSFYREREGIGRSSA